MRTPTTKLSKQKHRPMRQKLIITASVIGIATIAITGSVSASSLTESFNFNMFQFKEKEAYQLGKLSQEKSQKLSSVEKEAQEVLAEVDRLKQEKLEAEKQLEETKAEVSRLDDMFVKIDKYAPTSAGNTYAPGACTYGIKQWRPDLGNRWGDAKFWYDSAKSQGWNVGQEPKKNAVGVSRNENHVVLVIGVSLDGNTIRIKEMNYGGLWIINERYAPATDFKYIYELN